MLNSAGNRSAARELDRASAELDSRGYEVRRRKCHHPRTKCSTRALGRRSRGLRDRRNLAVEGLPVGSIASKPVKVIWPMSSAGFLML